MSLTNTPHHTLCKMAENTASKASMFAQGLRPRPVNLGSARNVARIVRDEVVERLSGLEDMELDASWRSVKRDLETARNDADFSLKTWDAECGPNFGA